MVVTCPGFAQGRGLVWGSFIEGPVGLAKGWLDIMGCGLGSPFVEQPNFEPERWMISRKLSSELPGWCVAGILLEP